MELIGRGEGVAILLNARARGVRRASSEALAAALPEATVLVSRSRDDARGHVRRVLDIGARLVLAGGGDGTIVGLLNLFREEGAGTIPTLGMLRLGTGNGWARATGAPSLVGALAEVPMLSRDLPTRTFDLVEVEGLLCHFAGVGWDATIINQYASLARGASRFDRWARTGIAGYMVATFGLTVPKEYRLLRREGQAQVEVINLGEPAWTIDPEGRPAPLRDAGPGAVLYRGPMSVAGVATEPQWGFGFRAYPFAGIKPGWLSARVYSPPVLEATRNWTRLWRGAHPQPGMHDFLVQRVRMTYSRPVPFQIGGDAMGLRKSVEYRVADCGVKVLDWQRARR